ncbi:ferrochelatase [Sanguibacter sp. HDW7]|uniref:ferrochelatase n=1 Tax=Sanguibacter sp. HDW7 TaxID=2714931 RepID=UPI00140A1C24|nr:ferrochelatase [Sanguibacter sp. HDW7]QIK84616.1 ferrochelatase [Sanguibacter sp. HDW7]
MSDDEIFRGGLLPLVPAADPHGSAHDDAHGCACGEDGCEEVEVDLDDYLAEIAAQLPPVEPSEPVAYDGVLLVGFGGPEGQDDVLPYLRNVTAGRGIPDERLEEVAVHYRARGGVSPINDQNRALRAALATELATRGLDLPVLWGNRNWDPYLADTLRSAADAGHRHLLAIVTSAYSSYSGCRQYREDLAGALESTGLAGTLRIDKVRQYFDSPGFVAPFVEGVRGALGRLRAAAASASGAASGDDDASADVRVLFCTHSIPTAAAEVTGPQTGTDGPVGWADGGAYEAQHYAVANAVMAAVDDTVPWELVYQSRSGDPRTPWLEPDINDRLAELAADPDERPDAVLIVPLGFVSDHMEVLWDLDTEALATCASLGILGERVPTPGVHPAFVAGLVDLVAERTAAPTRTATQATCGAAGVLGPWYDRCRPDCCTDPRGSVRAVVAEDVG